MSETWAPNTTDLPDLTPIRVTLKSGHSLTVDEIQQGLDWLYENRGDEWADMILSIFAPGRQVRTDRRRK